MRIQAKKIKNLVATAGLTGACYVAALAMSSGQASAALVIHADPNSLSNMFQDGGANGGTVPVTGAGDPIGWVNDLTSGFDLQQSEAGDDRPAVVVGPEAGSPFVMSFDGNDNLLMLGDFNSGNLVGPTTELDPDTMTLVLAGKVSSSGTGTQPLIDFAYDGSTTSVFGIDYDHSTGMLVGRTIGGSVSAPVLTDTWFVSELVWDSSNGLSLSVNGALEASGAASAAPVQEFFRMRIGATVDDSSGFLLGEVGDVYIYNSAAEDTGALVTQLVGEYIPEPTGMAFLLVGSVTMIARRRQKKC